MTAPLGQPTASGAKTNPPGAILQGMFCCLKDFRRIVCGRKGADGMKDTKGNGRYDSHHRHGPIQNEY